MPYGLPLAKDMLLIDFVEILSNLNIYCILLSVIAIVWREVEVNICLVRVLRLLASNTILDNPITIILMPLTWLEAGNIVALVIIYNLEMEAATLSGDLHSRYIDWYSLQISRSARR